ncbi:MAG TPA: hypothetical protein VGB94_09150 [Acidobacteriaceae bacterium]
MKRLPVILLMLCFTLPATLMAAAKKPIVSLQGMKQVYVGWVDLNPDAYFDLGYSSKDEWVKAIDTLNNVFQKDLKNKYLSNRTVMVSASKETENPAGSDLYIKFTDVSVDKHYRLHLTVHLIDPKTNAEIDTIPNAVYTGRVCGLVGCLNKSLHQVGETLAKRLEFAPKK